MEKPRASSIGFWEGSEGQNIWEVREIEENAGLWNETQAKKFGVGEIERGAKASKG